MNDAHPGPRQSSTPLDVPMTTIAKVGTSLWALGLVVTTVAWATGHLPVITPVTCTFGALFGLVTLRWAHRRTDTYRTDGTHMDEARADPP